MEFVGYLQTEREKVKRKELKKSGLQKDICVSPSGCWLVMLFLSGVVEPGLEV